MFFFNGNMKSFDLTEQRRKETRQEVRYTVEVLSNAFEYNSTILSV